MNKILKISLIFILFFLLFSLKTFAFTQDDIVLYNSNDINVFVNAIDDSKLYLSGYTANNYTYLKFAHCMYYDESSNVGLLTIHEGSSQSANVALNFGGTSLQDVYYSGGNGTGISRYYLLKENSLLNLNPIFPNDHDARGYTGCQVFANFQNNNLVGFYFLLTCSSWDYSQVVPLMKSNFSLYTGFIWNRFQISYYDIANNSWSLTYYQTMPVSNNDFLLDITQIIPNFNNTIYLSSTCYSFFTQKMALNYSANFEILLPKYTITPQIATLEYYSYDTYSIDSYSKTGTGGGGTPTYVFSNDIIYSPGVSPNITKNVSFVFDDYNLMKRFKYNVNLPLFSDYSKYFAFLRNVNRISGNEVYLTLDIYIIDLPSEFLEEEDYRDIFNWLMYDSDNSKCVFPYGMRLRHLQAIGKNNTTLTTSLIDSTITSRVSSDQSIMNKLVENLSSNYSDTFVFPRSTKISSNFLSSLVIYAFTDFSSLNVPIIR